MKALAFIVLMPVVACAEVPDTPEELVTEYLGIETRLVDDDIVQFDVAMTKALTPADVEQYADCAAAGYTLIRGYDFARHLRTKVYKASGIWRADAVYTISPALPRGSRTLIAEVVADDCAARGIPTV